MNLTKLDGNLWFRLLTATASVLATQYSTAQSFRYALTNLNATGHNVYPMAINSNSKIVGIKVYQVERGEVNDAVLIDLFDGMTVIATGENVDDEFSGPRETQWYATDINDKNEVALWNHFFSATEDYLLTASGDSGARWNLSKGLQSVDAGATGGISLSGAVFGQAGEWIDDPLGDVTYEPRAASYSPVVGKTKWISATLGMATCANAGGYAAGWVKQGNTQIPVFWSGQGQASLKLPPDVTTGQANAINDFNQVAGQAGQRAILWERSGGYRLINNPAGGTATGATAINRGRVVVGSGRYGSDDRAWFFDGRQVGWIDTYVGQGFRALSATDINDRGQVVGRGVLNGRVIGYCLTPTHYVKSFTLARTTVRGGASIGATIKLNAAAPAGGLTLSLNSTNANVSVPSTLTIPAGKSFVQATFSTRTVTKSQTTDVFCRFMSSGQGVTLTVTP